MYQSIAQLGQTKILWLLLTEDGHGVTSQGPTIEIRRNRDWYYIDFDTNSFVDIGGRREEPLAEHLDTTGFYSYDFSPPTFDETQQETYTMFYRNDSTEYGVMVAEEIYYQDSTATDDIYTTVEMLRKLLTNKTILRKLGIGQMEQEFFDDDGATIIKTDDIVKSGNEEIRTPRP